MKLSGFVPVFLSVLLLNIENATAQIDTKFAILQKASQQKASEEKVTFKKLLVVSKEKGWKMMFTGKYGSVVTLAGIDPFGLPIYLTTNNNIRAAATIRTNLLWTGGSTGLNLNGSSANLKGKIGIWDGGGVRTSHVELVNRVIQKDKPSSISNHSTHVAGIMIAAGINPLAKGMSWGAQQLVAYDFVDNEFSEMLAEAPNLLVSNHSYNTLAGWNKNETDNRWEFWGRAGETQDYKFGYYSTESQMLDSIAYNAPGYLMVFAAGNNRNLNGPAVGEPYWRLDANGSMTNAGNRPAGISSNDAYDIIASRAIAKNILTVGAINSIPASYTALADAQVAPFSSWGPTDDGRIKPDVVADGVNLLSSSGSSDNAYAIQSGTSMAAPSATGSLLLLQEYYSSLKSGAFMRAATLKGIVIHTADEAGNAGPDFQYGWGVINMEKAAAVITTNKTIPSIYENNLQNGAVYSLPIVATGKGPLIATISWTDPKANVETENTLNNAARKLTNDLDIRVKRGTTTYLPYVLNRTSPASPATTGDNNVDNVEKILIDDAVPGEAYTIEVSHKGVLQRGQQAYSLILSGNGGQPYCASVATASGGSISSITLGGFSVTNPAGCATYLNNIGLIAQLEPSKTTPVSITLGSCNNTSAGKIVKVFIDYNNNGNFTDAGETAVQSGVISGNGTFTGTITTPAGLSPGTSTIMRVVVAETATATEVTSCGAYARGQSEDLRVKFIAPSIDFAVTETISPESASCPAGSMYVSVRLKNFGSAPAKNIPLTAVIKNGNTTVATLTAVYPDTIQVNSTATYTFQTPFSAAGGTTYTITSSINLPSDQNSLNNQTVSTLVVSGLRPQPTGVAEICGTTDVYLKTTAANQDLPVWFNSATSNLPIASGNNTSTKVITANKTYYLSLNEVSGKVGLGNKMLYPNGGYFSSTGNFVSFKNEVPLTIETARLYIGNSGRITFTVADIVSWNKVTGVTTYNPLSSNTINVYATTPNPKPGDVNGNSAADTGAVYYLNLPVTTAGNHVILVQCLDGATIFRNNQITGNAYPFSIGNVFSITGNSATNPADTSDASYQQRFYYFFYELGIRLPACASPSRTAVVATTAPVPVITLAGNVLTSSSASGNQWYVNNNVIPGATTQTYTAATPGVYKTVIVDSFGCASSSNEINSGTTPVVDINGTTIALVASPNPNKGQFYLQFEVKGKDDLLISLVNNLGQEVYTSRYPGFTGRFNQQINTGKIGSGMYLLKIQHNKKVFVKKMLIQ